MKKQVVAIAALAGLALGAAMAQGSDSQGGGIVGSVHDLSGHTNGGTTGALYGVSDPGKRICAFCHSPHHSANNNQQANGVDVANLGGTGDSAPVNQYFVYAPLWSRTDLASATGYEPYVSQTFNPDAKGVAYDPLIGPSRLCLTCHDGTIALDAYYGKPAVNQTANATTDNFSGPAVGTKNIAIAKGMGLANDHPIGMKYTDFLGGNIDANGNTYELMPVASKFKDTSNSDAETKSVKSVLYSDPMNPAVTDFVTCASCHDVHNGKAVGNKAPSGGMRGFLLYGSQVNSSFCLTCHNKDDGTVPAGN